MSADAFDPRLTTVLERPEDTALTPSACTPLFFNAFRLRDAGAVLHSHSQNAMLATLLCEEAFRVTHLEMIKGLSGFGYHETLEVPVIENTAIRCVRLFQDTDGWVPHDRAGA